MVTAWSPSWFTYVLLAGPSAIVMFAAAVPKRFRSFWHFSPYRYNNSPAGVRAARKGSRRIDLDFQETLDERWAWTHWGRLWIEGFRYTQASVAVAARHGIKGVKPGALCRRTCKTTPYDLIATLRTKGGHSIGTASEALTLAAHHKVDVEVEAKGNPSQAMFDRLATRAQLCYGSAWREHVIVKRIWKSGASTTLHRAKNSGPGEGKGFHTIAIQIRTRRASLLPAWVDWYRR